MIKCDKGITSVVGVGNVILAEWGTLTLAILEGFAKNENESAEETEEFQEHLKKIMRESLEEIFEEAFSGKTVEKITEEKAKKIKGNLLKLLSEILKD